VRRRLFNLAAAVSLILCVATAVVSARSRWRTDLWTFAAGGNFFDCNATSGGISVQWLADVPADSYRRARRWD
jgi:hypothetical protein